MMDHNYQAIVEVLERYYDGLYKCDTGLLATVFHPQARYATASEGRLLHLDMPSYFSIVENRTSPQSRGETPCFDIESIEFGGPVTAFARMRCFMLSNAYTDFLSFLRVDENWQIIAKVFHVEPVQHSSE